MPSDGNAITDQGPADGWTRYLEIFHQERPGITEAVFEHAWDPDVGTAYDWLVSALPARPGRVVDIACGNAPLQPRIATADTYLGIDISMAELARARAHGRGPVVRADARHLPVPDGSVDTVVSSMGLMLVTPLADALREIARVLKPGGTLAALVPARWPLHIRDLRPGLTLAASLRGPAAMPQHVSPRRARAETERAGLITVSAERRRFAFPVRSPDDAALAVHALYTPGQTTRRLDAAVVRLSRLPRTAELPMPLLRIVARR